MSDKPLWVQIQEMDDQISLLNEERLYWRNMLKGLPQLIQDAQYAQSLFNTKVHELKAVDALRDDVINAMCQKIEATDKRIYDLMLLMKRNQMDLDKIRIVLKEVDDAYTRRQRESEGRERQAEYPDQRCC